MTLIKLILGLLALLIVGAIVLKLAKLAIVLGLAALLISVIFPDSGK